MSTKVQNKIGAEVELAKVLLKDETILLVTRQPVVEGTYEDERMTFNVTFPGTGRVCVVLHRNGDIWQGGLSVEAVFEKTIRFGTALVKGCEILVTMDENKAKL